MGEEKGQILTMMVEKLEKRERHALLIKLGA
jgi:hypothetical protein